MLGGHLFELYSTLRTYLERYFQHLSASLSALQDWVERPASSPSTQKDPWEVWIDARHRKGAVLAEAAEPCLREPVVQVVASWE